MIWIILAILALVLFGFSLGSVSLAPWVPTRRKDFERIEQLVSLRAGDNFIELGCGTAGLLLYLAKKYPRIKFVGIEIAWPLFLTAWLRVRLLGLNNVKVILKNIFKHNLSQYDVIFSYGLRQEAHTRLARKIGSECQSGCMVISYTFPLPQLNLITKDKPDLNHVAIYLYRL